MLAPSSALSGERFPADPSAWEPIFVGQAKFQPCDHLLSRDARPGEGAKEFCGFIDSSQSLVARYITDEINGATDQKPPRMYEVILDSENTLVNLILDLERPFTKDEKVDPVSARLVTWDTIKKLVSKLLSQLAGEASVELRPGHNCQAKESLYSHKFSMHLLVYCAGFTMKMCEAIAMQLDQMCKAMAPYSKERTLLVSVSNGVPKSIVDTSIYTNKRSIRLLGCTKWKSDKTEQACMVAAFGSSEDVKAHLVCVDGNELPPSEHRLPPLDLSKLPSVVAGSSGSQTKGRIVTFGPPQTIPGSGDTSVEEIKPAIRFQPKIRDAVRVEILEGDSLRSLLKVSRVEIASETVKKDGWAIEYRLKHGVTCPYAKRVHASNNGLKVVYDHLACRLTIYCYDRQDCGPSDKLSLPLLLPSDASLGAISLHVCENCVTYHEGNDYDLPCMQPYPENKKILAITANMGAGKTVELVRYLKARMETTPGLRILVVVFRRVLADKMAAELGEPFVNYQDRNGRDLQENCLVIQLDSVGRISSDDKYDVVVFDEALSTVIHASSPLIKDVTAVLVRLTVLLRSSKQVILLDACTDDFPSYLFVEYLERLIGESATWIRNRYIRPPQRTATVLMCNSPTAADTGAWLSNALSKIKSYVDAGRNVYVPCTSKSDAIDVVKYLVEECGFEKKELGVSPDTPQKPPRVPRGSSHSKPKDIIKGGPIDKYVRTVQIPLTVSATSTKKVLLITSETDDDARREVAKSFAKALSQVQVFVCSPAITAGASFEQAGHFTRVVALMRNMGLNGPSVDSAIQQLGRVRTLAEVSGDDGHMDIFIKDPSGQARKAWPTDKEALHTYLEDRRQGDDQFAINNSIPDAALDWRGDTRYDRQSLAYTLMLGFYHMKFKSMQSYTAIIQDHLVRAGINADIMVAEFSSAVNTKEMTKKGKIAESEKSRALIELTVKHIGDNGLPTHVDFEVAAKKREPSEDPTPWMIVLAAGPDGMKSQIKHVYEMVCMYEVDGPGLLKEGYVEDFIRTYVGAFNEREEAVQILYALRRFEAALGNSVQDLMKAYLHKVQCVGDQAESAIELNRLPTFHHPLIYGAALLDELDSDWRKTVKEEKEWTVPSVRFPKALKSWLERLADDEEYEALKAMMKILCHDSKAVTAQECP